MLVEASTKKMKYGLTSKLAQNLVVLWRSWWLKFLLLLDLLVCLMTQFGGGKRNLSLVSIRNAPKSGRPKSASRKEIVSKIKEIIEGDARFTARDIARKVGISLSTVHLILKKHLKVRKISARWVSHLLTDEQKRQRVKVAKKLLQMFPKYDKKQSANVVTGDETWVHYFEPVRKVSNKIWATKHSKRPIIAKRSLSTKTVLYAIFSGEGVAIKVPVKKGKSITRKYYKDVVLKKLKKYYQKRRPATGFKHVHLLHDNAPAHTSAIVTVFFKKEKVTVLPHPPVFPRPCPMWFLFVSEIESIPCWAEIPVPTGTWICYSSIPYYCAKISVPWRLQEVDTLAETLHF